MKKNFFNNEEIKCLKRMFSLASLTRYSLFATLISLLPLVFLAIDDFIRFQNNVPRTFSGKYLYLDIIVVVVLLIIWAVFYITLKKNLLNNKIWQNILEKVDGANNFNAEIENTNSNIKSIIPVYLLSNLISSNKNLKEVGNTIRTISGIAIVVLIIKSCSVIIKFAKNISKVYNIPLKSNDKLYFVLFIVPALVIIALDISDTISDIKNGNVVKDTIVNSLKENCEQNSYCNFISSYDDAITIRFNEELDAYSTLELDENKKIKSISIYLDYDKNIPKDEIVDDANTKIRQITDLINSGNIACAYNFICQEHQLSNEFINKFYNMSDTDTDGYDTYYDHELGNQYSIKTNSYIREGRYNNSTDMIHIHFAIDN